MRKGGLGGEQRCTGGPGRVHQTTIIIIVIASSSIHHHQSRLLVNLHDLLNLVFLESSASLSGPRLSSSGKKGTGRSTRPATQAHARQRHRLWLCSLAADDAFKPVTITHPRRQNTYTTHTRSLSPDTHAPSPLLNELPLLFLLFSRHILETKPRTKPPIPEPIHVPRVCFPPRHLTKPGNNDLAATFGESTTNPRRRTPPDEFVFRE